MIGSTRNAPKTARERVVIDASLVSVRRGGRGSARGVPQAATTDKRAVLMGCPQGSKPSSRDTHRVAMRNFRHRTPGEIPTSGEA
jgi:hypothetical protein